MENEDFCIPNPIEMDELGGLAREFSVSRSR